MIWVDLDNSPHVPLFRPLIAELERRSEKCFVTSRAHAQTEDLLRLWKMDFVSVGVHGGKHKVAKVLNLLARSSALKRSAKGKRIALAMSHGSRTHLVAAKRMGIPYLWMHDYEFQEKSLANWLANYILLPACIPDARVKESGYALHKVIRYNGLKEEIYLNDFRPAADFRKTIGIRDTTILVTMRPPSVTANYHNPASEELFRKSIEYFSSFPRVHCLIANRTSAERDLVLSGKSSGGKVEILRKAVDGLQLLWHSDFVVGGGGTMNREAAALGVPVYSIFSGRRPYVDEYLQEQGRLFHIRDEQEMRSIPVEKRQIGLTFRPPNPGLGKSIVDLILDIERKQTGS